MWIRCIALSHAAAGCLLAASAAIVHAQPIPDATIDPLKIAAEITDHLCRLDTDAAAAEAGKYSSEVMGTVLKSSFQVVRQFGECQYKDLLYSRDYGQMEKDIIYKISYEKQFAVFIRYLFHVFKGKWLLSHIDLQDERDLPLPRQWQHIYPK